jgi:hypothetical protein
MRTTSSGSSADRYPQIVGQRERTSGNVPRCSGVRRIPVLKNMLAVRA